MFRCNERLQRVRICSRRPVVLTHLHGAPQVVYLVQCKMHTFVVPHEAKRFDRLLPASEVRGFGNFEIHVAIQEKDLDILCTLHEQLQMNVRMFACGTVEDRSSDIRGKRRKVFHQPQCQLPQVPQPRRLAVAEEKFVVSAYFFFDLGIIRHEFAPHLIVAEYLSCGLALGRAVIRTVFGNHAGRRRRDLGSQYLYIVTAHRVIILRTEAGRGSGKIAALPRNGSSCLDQGGRVSVCIPLSLLKHLMHIHILGICGTFMGGLAVLAKEAGHKVTGCDANVYPPMSTQLQAQGIELIEGFNPDQVSLKPDLYVIGNVVSRGNPLMEEILNRGLPYTSGPQWIGEHILQNKWVLAVAGTHGKTTTSSMLAWLLEDAGYHPGFLIGGVPMNFGISARLSGREADSAFFVIEADEYDTAFFDKRSKFVHYRAKTAVLNNLEYDHADIFPDLGAIETQFHHLVRTVPGVGRLIVNGREESLRRVITRGCWSEKEWFGVHDHAGWGMREHEDGSFDVSFEGQVLGTVHWNLTGEHNRLNAVAAIAAARHAGVPPEQAIDSIGKFESVKRRMEVRGVVGGVTVYDDFAHHPTAIATTVAGLRRKVGHERILAVLEPRSNTMKLGTMKEALPGSLRDADLVFGYGAKSGKDALGWDLGAALAPLDAKGSAFDDLDALVQAIVAAARPGDHVLVMSNGGFGGVHQKILDRLSQ